MSANAALQQRRIAASRLTKHRQKQQRNDTTSLPFERARRLNQGAQGKGPAPALTEHCDQVRARVGIPVGLWAVVTGRITGAHFGMALLSGHTELLEGMEM